MAKKAQHGGVVTATTERRAGMTGMFESMMKTEISRSILVIVRLLKDIRAQNETIIKMLGQREG